jgi:hypothetical protein
MEALSHTATMFNKMRALTSLAILVLSFILGVLCAFVFFSSANRKAIDDGILISEKKNKEWLIAYSTMLKNGQVQELKNLIDVQLADLDQSIGLDKGGDPKGTGHP